MRGGEFYDSEVTRRYLAHRHAGVASPNHVMEEPAVLGHLGDLKGCRVVDLGCGDGSFAEIVLGAGADHYLGVDGSAAMIDLARERASGSGATFVLSAIEDVRWAAGSVDLVTSRMAFHYVSDLGPVFRSVHRALTPGGRFVFTVPHPVITCNDDQAPGPRSSWIVDHYFDSGERRRGWFGAEVTWFHRTIEHYVRAVLDAGFEIQAVSECEPDSQRLAGHPDELERRHRVPVVLLIGALRRDGR